MSATVSQANNVDLSAWAPGVRMFRGSDGRNFIVDADTDEYGDGPIKIVRRKTAVLYCESDGTVTDLVPDHLYPAGTTCEEVLTLLGYEGP